MRQVNVALIGGGFMGRAHSLAMTLAPIAQDLGLQVSKQVLVDIAPDAAATAQALGWASSCSDWGSVIADPRIDVVDICTPPHLHEPIALAAMAAGKHVFCEKPMTNDAQSAERMVRAAEAAGVVTQVGFNYRHSPAVMFAKKLLDDGRLGVPLQFRGSYLQENGFRADPGRWRAQKSTGGSGALGDIGSHVISTAEYLLGDIVRVSASLRSKAQSDHMLSQGWLEEKRRFEDDLIDDAGAWIAEFSSGVIGTFVINTFAHGSKNRLQFGIDASRGAVEFNWNNLAELAVAFEDDPRDQSGFRTIHMNDQHPNGWWSLAGIGTGYLDVSAMQFQEFFRAIRDGRAASPDFGEAAHVQKVVDAVSESATSGLWVTIDRTSKISLVSGLSA